MARQSSTIDNAELAAMNQKLAEEVLRLLGNEEQFELFADDIVMDFPYGSSLSMPDHFAGKTEVVAYVRELNRILEGMKMRDMVFYSIQGSPETVFIEYSSDAPTPGGNWYEQVYVNKMTFRDGKLVYMREFWDPKRILDARSGVYDQASE
jgi:ketosteroid isomerase-like protein